VIGNVVGSGTAIIDTFGAEHMRSGAWIVYTSADSVFQIAAHEDVVPLDELYAACDVARALLLEPHNVSRVIARPFEGEPGRFERVSAHRRDVSIEPPGETLLDALQSAGVARTGIGKSTTCSRVARYGSTHTPTNAAGIEAIGEWLRSRTSGFLFVNLVDFDQLFGHRNDAAGFYGALREFDRALPSMLSTLREDDLLFITADHGNDPTTASTDHARECVPLLAAGPRVRAVDLGRRSTFSDLGATGRGVVRDFVSGPRQGVSLRARESMTRPARAGAPSLESARASHSRPWSAHTRRTRISASGPLLWALTAASSRAATSRTRRTPRASVRSVRRSRRRWLVACGVSTSSS
jgi:phosphopentomutase